MTNFFMIIINWISKQIEWCKSFLSEPIERGGKASIKRLISFIVVMSFLQAYIKTTLDTKVITDIPSNWMFLIAGIIGLHILDKYVESKKKEN